MELAANKALEISRSPLAKVRRRMQYFVRYILARSQSQALGMLLPIIENSFRHPWVAEVQLQIRFWWPDRYANRERPLMHWDAPVVISVFRRIRGKKRPALLMSLFVTTDTLYIQQIQGIPRTDVPRDLGTWPKMFMEACRTFAYQQKFKEMRVPRAASLYSYHHPFISPEILPDARERALQRIRKRMETLYDANALELGFVPDGRWFKWINPMIPQPMAAKRNPANLGWVRSLFVLGAAMLAAGLVE
jgi:hypothetical protein